MRWKGVFKLSYKSMLCRCWDDGSLIQRFLSSLFGERQTKVQLTLAQDRSRLLFQMEQWDWRGKMHNGHGVAKCHDALSLKVVTPHRNSVKRDTRFILSPSESLHATVGLHSQSSFLVFPRLER